MYHIKLGIYIYIYTIWVPYIEELEPNKRVREKWLKLV